MMAEGFCADEPELLPEPRLGDTIPLKDVIERVVDTGIVSLFDRGMGGGCRCPVI